VSSERSYDYCKVFVKHDEPTTILARLAALLGAEPERRTLELAGLVLDVRKNPDTAPDAGDDFVQWPVIVEAETESPNAGPATVQAMTRILNDLWTAGIPAVAACDFEDELPWRGGIQRLGT
jgi:hypothetical protein